jgi:hypothetical protein
MVNLDQDGTEGIGAGTFNSSSSRVDLPDGAEEVLFAGLYWGARRTGSSSGQNTTDPLNRMSLRFPAASTYTTISADESFVQTGDETAYQQFANLTDEVETAGEGVYWGANVAAGRGEDRYAGWTLAIVYRDPTQPLRNITVFDGFSNVRIGSSESITISGFLTRPTGR